MAKGKESKETPLMRQYAQIKENYPDTVLLFRMGDFFETFGEDAVIASKVAGLTLTKRNNGGAGETELAGFPHHQLDSYLPKFVQAGYRVAVCEQLEDPKLAQGIVKRGVVEVVTPGVALYDRLLDSKTNNFLAAIRLRVERNGFIHAGIAFADVSTGEFQAGEFPFSQIPQIIELIAPSEILISKDQKGEFAEAFERLAEKPSITKIEDWFFEESFVRDILLRNLKTKSLAGFGLEDSPLAVAAAGACLHYISELRNDSPRHIQSIRKFELGDNMTLDYATRRNLEIVYSSGGANDSLIGIIDKTSTASGGRLLKRWVTMPSKKLKTIQSRLDAVEGLIKNREITGQIRSTLSQTSDIERVCGKISAAKVNPRELEALKITISLTKDIKASLLECGDKTLDALANGINPPAEVYELINDAIAGEPTVQLGTGRVFRCGFNPELDEYCNVKDNARALLAEYQESERAATGINSLKVNFNSVFGYYIEITHAHAQKVPERYTRKQTLVNAERFITPELKELEDKILNAESKISELENALFAELRIKLLQYVEPIYALSQGLAIVDCLVCFESAAREYGYSKPIIDESFELEIKGGRHPVVERLLQQGEKYTPNDSKFDYAESGFIHIITGPNMSGKSSYLRQVGLIVLLGQIGCYVPADYAKFGIVDRIFTRVGAQDNISRGESTFLVEMQEAANIMNNATNRSLILLDEVGRGTATYDGISIAWSIAEYIHDKIRAKTLFATHYHELTALEEKAEGIKNYRVEVIETGSNIIFSHKLSRGASDHSFGIHVAQMAGLPYDVIERARGIVRSIEGGEEEIEINKADTAKIKSAKKAVSENQLAIFELRDDSLRDRLRELRIETMTPVQALGLLAELIAEAKGGKK